MATSFVDRVDGFQQRHTVLAFPVAVWRKYCDDGGDRLAALITYYGFLSIVPLLTLGLATFTLALNREGFQDNLMSKVPEMFKDVVEGAIANLPSGGLPLIIGVGGLLLTGLGVVSAGQYALNHMWLIPYRDRPSIAMRYLKGLGLLLLTFVGALTIAGAGVVASRIPWLPRVVSGAEPLIAGAILTVVLTLALRLAIPGAQPLRSSLIGSLVAAAAITALATFGGALIAVAVRKAGPVYGSLASIVGVFTVLLLVSRILIVSAEISSVLELGLWPRGISAKKVSTPADAIALQLQASRAERVVGQRNAVALSQENADERATDQEATDQERSAPQAD